MRLTRTVVEFTDQMVADCGLDTTSIFFYDETAGSPLLSYLYHVGVSEDAKHAYADGHIYESDPFTLSLMGQEAASGTSRFRLWEDDEISSRAAQAQDYRQFLASQGVVVVGALTRRLVPGLCMIIGTHCKEGSRSKANVPVRLLENRAQTLSDMVAMQLLEDMVLQQEGHVALRSALGTPAAGPRMPDCLTRREREIAQFICRGKQNKEIAFLAGLSEYTVENHLRRIYRKLGIPNRAALAARMGGQLQ